MKALAAAARAWRLSTEAYRGERLSRRLKQNLRWALAAALHPGTALDWFARLDTEGLSPFKEANPILAFKPMRTYLSTRWGAQRRTKVMRETYAFVLWRGGAAREALLKPGGGVPLARVPLGELGEGELLLGFDNRFRKEGEFAVLFEVPALGGRVCSLSFALEWRDNGLSLFAGCVQGVTEGDEDRMKALGKAMHGLRPKALVVFAAQEVARGLGARELYGAGNTIQVHRRKHLIHIAWAHQLTFDYDAFWSELGGREAFDGWFFLPRRARKRTREEIKPNKRSLYAKRYAMQDDLAAQIRRAMAAGPDEQGRATDLVDSP
ncbi:DUF535 family protein [Mesoterricola sediminis]|uniref:DUF535 domain-containing protein n=1 Tax=Mesoterricola sediminis TaxID=2927980 RepID=A0AA48KBG7_9BACT|nr:DUF535 family protein [Mesoterricola sediminis]BDU75065.1 hypothetical protein METESE_00230 [Mesoterricola sediminis]